jgi:hypothetical protein
MSFPSLPRGDFRSIEDVQQKLPSFKWRVHDTPEGGRTAFTVIAGSKETGELHVFAVIERGTAPEHEHVDGGPYGELVITIAGELEDVTDDGEAVVLRPGQVLFHRGGSVHAPKSSTFWFGYYHQPRGSKLTRG